VGQAIRDVADGTLGEDKLAKRLLQSALDVALGHPTRIHLDDQLREYITGAALGRPQLGAIRFPESPHLRELQAQDTFCGLHGALFIAITISLWGLLPFVATPAECLGLLLLERFLEDP
jgi:hypothetical protein